MTREASEPTPFEAYSYQKDEINREAAEISGQIASTRQQLRGLENDLKKSEARTEKISGAFIDAVFREGGLYAATFELECRDGLELPRDVNKAEKANFVARQLMRLNDVLVESDQAVPVLVVRGRMDIFTSSETGASYPRPDEIHEREEQWLEAELYQAVPSKELEIRYTKERKPFRGVLKTAVGIDMLVASERKLYVTRGGMDHDTWINGPFTNKMDHLDVPGKHNIYNDISRTRAEVVVSTDWLPEGAISGIFADAEVIAKVYDNATKIPQLGSSTRKLGEMLADHGIDI